MGTRAHLCSDTIVLNEKPGPKACAMTGSCPTTLTKNEAADVLA